MRKISLFAVITLLIVLLTSCSTSSAVVEEYENDFFAFKAEINAERQAEYKKNYNYSDFKKYLVDNSSDRTALTSTEINALKNDETKNKSTLSYEEMEEDVDLYFRVLRSQSGSYYYFGGNEKFDTVKQSILDQLKGKVITRKLLANTMIDAMSFIVDRHFRIYDGKDYEFVKDVYWFCYTNDIFLKDENGFYFEKEGKRYYWVSCDNPDVSVQRRLFDDGTLAYGLIQFTPRAKIHNSDQITLLCEGQETVTTVEWIRSKPVSQKSFRNPSFKHIKYDNVSYVRLCSFDRNYKEQLEKFAESASSVKGSDLILFDIRSNGGGDNSYLNTWFKSFTGYDYDIKTARARRIGELNNTPDNSKAYDYHESQGTIINNRAPMIILVDNNCGSSGESAYMSLRTLKNSIVIGTNTSGCASFGNSVTCVLPNSGIRFTYGTDIHSFSEPMESVDGKGFLPDLWCNPSTAMTAVENMLKKYNIVNEESLTELMGLIDQSSISTIQLKIEGDVVDDGVGFGCGNRQFNVYVLSNGEIVSDYEYSVADSIGTITKQYDGALTLKATKEGNAWITIMYKGSTAKFRWRN